MDQENAVEPSFEGANRPRPMFSRAYQIEMCEASMRENVIVTMDTGSGKTQIAKMRIEEELLRSPGKRVWFLTPTVVLAQQQHQWLSSYLPMYGVRLIVGSDNVQSWSTQDTWDKILGGIDLVVCTAQILLDALEHGFVKFLEISLLVFDEAHHGSRGHPMAKIMAFFRAHRANASQYLPHILGLSASVIRKSVQDIQRIEDTYFAKCVTPVQQIEEYRNFVHVPKLDRIVFESTPSSQCRRLHMLSEIVESLNINTDPRVQWLSYADDEASTAKLAKIYQTGTTPIIKEVGSFLRDAINVNDAIGSWACNAFILACLHKLQKSVQNEESLLMSLHVDEQRYMFDKLKDVLLAETTKDEILQSKTQIAPKTSALIEYLLRSHRRGFSTIVFVKRRSTAWALKQVLQQLRETHHLHVCSFVGISSFAGQSLKDLADQQEQKDSFVGFKTGSNDVCIATQVMEEGIDVQAVNLVVRFDEPETFRAYVQSRGRARNPDSRLVLVQNCQQDLAAVQTWTALESEMKLRCSDIERELAFRETMENLDEKCDEVYEVKSTRAQLTYDNARSHVQHYCATLPKSESDQTAEPTVIINGTIGESVRARIILPASVAPTLREAQSLRAWKSEKAAVRDASFQCYRKLHMAAAVNDNLLPFRIESSDNEDLTRESIYTVSDAIKIWRNIIQDDLDIDDLYPHTLTISGPGFNCTSLLWLIPHRLDRCLTIKLYETPYGELNATVMFKEDWESCSLEMALFSTEKLFQSILGRRLKLIDLVRETPYLLIPDLKPTELAIWAETVKSDPIPLKEALITDPSKIYLVRHHEEEILYHWTPRINQAPVQLSPGDTIYARRMTKNLHFLVPGSNLQIPKERHLLVSDCYIEPLSAEIGRVLLFIPSVAFRLETTLRAQAAMRGPLRSVAFTDSELLAEALTSRPANQECNYDRLEFLGDAILKYYATVQVFFDFPVLDESALTVKRKGLISNARLQQRTRDLGLDAYITTHSFSTGRWTLSEPGGNFDTRSMSSKVLADVVEAVLGAATVEDKSGNRGEDLTLASLQLFLPDTAWISPKEHVRTLKHSKISHLIQAKADDIEMMLQYRFSEKSLLLEALTKTSFRPDVSSYEKLEFLGDAVIDRIVSAALYDGIRISNSQRLTECHHALVNHYFLAYLGMSMVKGQNYNQAITLADGKIAMTSTERIRRLIDYCVRSTDKSVITQREQAEQTFLKVQFEVQQALEHSKFFPWTLLHAIDTNKIYSDLVESVIGAIFIDSGADLRQCQQVLETIGLTKVINRFIAEPGLETRTPLAILRVRKPDILVTRKSGGSMTHGTKNWKCVITLDGEELAVCTSTICQVHADSSAAEKALSVLENVVGK